LSDSSDEAAMLRVLVKRGEDPIANKRQGLKNLLKCVASRNPSFSAMMRTGKSV
jgi:hypothetical protein